MYFYIENDSQSPCGGKIHFQASKLTSIKQFAPANQYQFSKINNFKLNSNGEEAKFTNESSASQGADF